MSDLKTQKLLSAPDCLCFPSSKNADLSLGNRAKGLGKKWLWHKDFPDVCYEMDGSISEMAFCFRLCFVFYF